MPGRVTEEVFGFLVSITHNSVFITHNSKMVGPMTQKLAWIFITLFPVFVFIIQFSNFWVMSYENWKHILSVFSFQNSIFNGIFVIKHTYRDPLSVPCQVWLPLSHPHQHFFLHTKNPTHRNSFSFPNPSISHFIPFA